ncbi:hypothetical protein L7F22_019340 [Adiantum nelumboides]|nr:hypothetical protein [Adiantum nelumboides]
MLRFQDVIRDLDKSEFNLGTRQRDAGSSQQHRRPSFIDIPGSFLELGGDIETQRTTASSADNHDKNAQTKPLARVRANFSRFNPFKEDSSIRKATQRSMSRRSSKETISSNKTFDFANLSLPSSKRSKARMSANVTQQSNKYGAYLHVPESFNTEKYTNETLEIASWRLSAIPSEEFWAVEEAMMILDMNHKGRFDQQSFNRSFDTRLSQANVPKVRKPEYELPKRPRTMSLPPRPPKGRLRSKHLDSLPPTSSSHPEDEIAEYSSGQKSIVQGSPKSTWTCSTTEENIPPSPFFYSMRGSSSSSATTAEWSEVSSLGFEDAIHTVDIAPFSEKLRQYRMRLPSIGEQSFTGTSPPDRSRRPKTSSRLSRSSSTIPPPRLPPPTFELPSTPIICENYYCPIPSSPPLEDEDSNPIF